MKLYVGDIVEFTYKGGSKPGAKRVAYILNGDTNAYVKAWDFDKGELRTFTLSKITDCRFLEDGKELKMIDMDLIPKGLDLADAWQKTGWKTFKNGNILVAVNPIKHIDTTLIGSWYGRTINLTTPKGTKVKLVIGSSSEPCQVALIVNSVTITPKCTAELLQRALST